MLKSSQLDADSPLQRQLIISLRQNNAQTYSQLKPDGVEGNAFNYHLRTLVKQGLIEQDDKTYKLTSDGMLLSDTYSLDKSRVQARPYFFVYVMIRYKDHILTYTPTREPGAGITTVHSGKLHYEDSLMDGVKREAMRRGATKYVVERYNPVNVRFLQDGKLSGQRAGVLFELKSEDMFKPTNFTSGLSKWVSQQDIDSDPQYRYVKKLSFEGLIEIDVDVSIR